MKSWLSIFIFLFLFCFKVHSQNKNKIGLDFQLGYQSENIVDWPYATTKSYRQNTNFSLGLVYERALSKRNSIVAEVKFRNSPNQYIFLEPGGGNLSEQVILSGNESSLSIPILFKRTTKILNFSLGPTFEYFLNWQLTASASNSFIPYSALPKYFFPDKISLGLLLKICKSLKITERCSIEPGIFYNPMLSYKNNYFGFSLPVKYRF